MRLEIVFSHQAKKFVLKNSNLISTEKIADAVELAIRKIVLREMNQADVILLKGQWAGYWRVRSGGIRTIFEFNGRDPVIVNIEKIEHRGSVY
jgi:mRNA-degrading endonuclease RelE of RelBE toxin-antitoxin system